MQMSEFLKLCRMNECFSLMGYPKTHSKTLSSKFAFIKYERTKNYSTCVEIQYNIMCINYVFIFEICQLLFLWLLSFFTFLFLRLYYKYISSFSFLFPSFPTSPSFLSNVWSLFVNVISHTLCFKRKEHMCFFF